MPKTSKLVGFWPSYSNNKNATIFETHCTYAAWARTSYQTLSWMKGWASEWLIESRFAGSRTRIFSRKSLSCVTLRSWSSGIRWPPTMSASRSLLGLIVLRTVTFSYTSQNYTPVEGAIQTELCCAPTEQCQGAYKFAKMKFPEFSRPSKQSVSYNYKVKTWSNEPP